ncbi:MAG: AlpA family transcriptional regulator [Pseudomonadota bacterium]
MRATAHNFQLNNRLLRRHEVEQKTGKSRAAIYDAIRAGTFPAPVPIGAHSVAWIGSEVEAWLLARIAERDRLQPAPNRSHATHPQAKEQRP